MVEFVIRETSFTTKTDGSFTIAFGSANGPITQPNPIIGMSHFQLTYGAETDHHVAAINAGVSAEYMPSGNLFELQGNVSLGMHDSSGHYATGSCSLIAIAAFGGDPLNSTNNNPVVQFLTGSQETNREYYHAVNNQVVVWPVLAGFQSRYAIGEDHHVEEIDLSISARQANDSSQWSESWTNVLKDRNGNEGDPANQWTYPSFVLISEGNPMVAEYASVTNSGKTTDVTFADQPLPMERAVVFVRGFDMTYGTGKDHHVSTLMVDAGNSSVAIVNTPQSNGLFTSKVTFKPNFEMQDKNGNNKATGQLQLLVVGLQQATPAA